MEILILGLVLFLVPHSVSIVSPSWRDAVAGKLGEMRWQGLYSLVAIIGFVLIIWGYVLARQSPVVLYVPPIWMRHVALLLMVFFFPLLLATYFPGKIKAFTRHPMLLSVQVWSVAHLLANGMLADVVLFGSFLVWSVTDRVSMTYREERPLPGAPPSAMNDLIAVAGGLALYFLFFFWLHAYLFVVSPVG